MDDGHYNNDHHWYSPRYSSVQWYRQQYCTSTPAIHTIRAKDSPWESETRKLYSYYSVVSKAQPPWQSVSGLLTYTLTGEGHTELYVDEWSIGAVDFYANTKYTQKVNIGHPQSRILYVYSRVCVLRIEHDTRRRMTDKHASKFAPQNLQQLISSAKFANNIRWE